MKEVGRGRRGQGSVDRECLLEYIDAESERQAVTDIAKQWQWNWQRHRVQDCNCNTYWCSG